MAKRKGKKKAKSAPGYAAASRRLAASYVFVAPLFAIYQLALAADERVRNGTDWIFAEMLAPFRQYGLVFLNFLILGLLLFAIGRMRKERQHIRFMYGWMFLESLAWGGFLVVLATVLGRLTDQLAIGSIELGPYALDWMTGIGAGIYEEVLFRFLLMGGLVLMLHRGLGGRLVWVVPLAVIVAALLFSLAHHRIGGEPWNRSTFWFRALMGVALGVLYWGRGLGVVVYTHAIYNGIVLTWSRLEA